MEYKRSGEDSLDINISDLSGHRTLAQSLMMLLLLLAAILGLAYCFQYFASDLISRTHERSWVSEDTKFFKFRAEPSKDLTLFTQELTETHYPFDVYITDSKIANAYCSFGDKIYITKKLLESVDSENELAFILAHEMGHSEHRHIIKSLSYKLLLSLVFNSLGLHEMGFNLSSMKHSRNLEQEADNYALAKVKKFYGHTWGAEDFFIKLEAQKNQATKWFETADSYFSTHPGNAERIQQILKSRTGDTQNKRITKKKSLLLQKILKYKDSLPQKRK